MAHIKNFIISDPYESENISALQVLNVPKSITSNNDYTERLGKIIGLAAKDILEEHYQEDVVVNNVIFYGFHPMKYQVEFIRKGTDEQDTFSGMVEVTESTLYHTKY
jgi:hypothetical protein